MLLLCWLIPNPAANSRGILKQKKPSTFVVIISKCVIGHYFEEKGGAKSGYQVLKCFVCFVDFSENLLWKAQESWFTMERVV